MSACGNCRGLLTCNCFFEVDCIEETEIGESILLQTAVDDTYVTTPDSPALSVTGDLDIRAKIAADDYTSATGNNTIVSKWMTVGGERSYLFAIDNPVPRLYFQVSSTGADSFVLTSNDVLPVGDGATIWVRVNFTADAGSGDREARFYYSFDGVNWIKLGSTINQAGAISIFDSNTDVEIGSKEGGQLDFFFGRIYYVEIRRGPDKGSTLNVRFDGDIVGVFDARRAFITGPQTPNTVDSITGETWTVNGDDWQWTSQTAETCTTLTGNGAPYAPYNFRPNNVPLPRPYGHISRRTAGAQTAPASSLTVITFTDSETPFDGGMVDLVGAPTRLTAPVDGYYLTYAQVTYEGTPTNMLNMSLRKTSPSGLITVGDQEMYSDIGTYSFVSLIDMAAGDYLEVYVVTDGGGPADILTLTLGSSVPDPFPGVFFSFPHLWAEWVRPL